MIATMKQQRLIQKPIIKSDMGTQTDTHILEYNIVKTYEWNEWELRRKALKMVRLSQHRGAVISLIFSLNSLLVA